MTHMVERRATPQQEAMAALQTEDVTRVEACIGWHTTTYLGGGVLLGIFVF